MSTQVPTGTGRSLHRPARGARRSRRDRGRRAGPLQLLRERGHRRHHCRRRSESTAADSALPTPPPTDTATGSAVVGSDAWRLVLVVFAATCRWRPRHSDHREATRIRGDRTHERTTSRTLRGGPAHTSPAGLRPRPLRRSRCYPARSSKVHSHLEQLDSDRGRRPARGGRSDAHPDARRHGNTTGAGSTQGGHCIRRCEFSDRP